MTTPNAPTAREADISAVIAAAIDELNRLCAGRGRMTRDGLAGRDWTMCIPHHDTDSDHVFAELVIACKRLQAENRDLLESQLAARREVRALRDALEWVDKEASLEVLYAGGEGYLAFASRLKARARAALAATQEEK